MEDKLRKLGFTEIQSLRLENRDDLYRMTWVGTIEDKFWTILLVKKNDEWLIDRLTIDMDANQQMEKMCFDSPDPIEFILGLISKEQGNISQ